MPNTVGFETRGWFQQKRVEQILIVVGETPAPQPIDEEIVCEITMSNQINRNPDFEFFRGDSHNQLFRVTLAGTGFDLDGWSIVFSVKHKKSDDDAVIEKKNALAGGGDSEIEIIDSDEGTLVVKILPLDTTDLQGDITYYYDLQGTKAGTTLTFKLGFLRLIGDITT